MSSRISQTASLRSNPSATSSIRAPSRVFFDTVELLSSSAVPRGRYAARRGPYFLLLAVKSLSTSLFRGSTKILAIAAVDAAVVAVEGFSACLGQIFGPVLAGVRTRLVHRRRFGWRESAVNAAVVAGQDERVLQTTDTVSPRGSSGAGFRRLWAGEVLQSGLGLCWRCRRGWGGPCRVVGRRDRPVSSRGRTPRGSRGRRRRNPS
jgi:hypothetical protein